MRSRMVHVVASTLALVVLTGCVTPTPTTPAPVLGLHSLGESAAIGEMNYTVNAEFSPMPDRPDLELLTVRVDWWSSVPDKTDELNIKVFASDGVPRVVPADAESLGGVSDEMEGWESGSSGQAKALFSVRKGETGLVVTVDDGTSQDLRWQLR